MIKETQFMSAMSKEDRKSKNVVESLGTLGNNFYDELCSDPTNGCMSVDVNFSRTVPDFEWKANMTQFSSDMDELTKLWKYQNYDATTQSDDVEEDSETDEPMDSIPYWDRDPIPDPNWYDEEKQGR